MTATRYGPQQVEARPTVTIVGPGPHVATGRSRDAWASEEIDVPTPELILRQRRQLNDRAYRDALEVTA